MILSKEQELQENLNHEYTLDYFTNLCKSINLDSENIDSALYDLCFQLLNPSYKNRITAKNALKLI